ncbi:hypothetical protein E2562_004433 [Oryza meyeriana var. granulata]|uniref:Uncharacterized protein n=1 Tax=Oryza meyeriana var. granulata TaxID=110450 RepID=A0A6G1CXV6_9ORYZ|nr:hypothetical protein E2562_004433 [Oryza meyeriana var. granulata]
MRARREKIGVRRDEHVEAEDQHAGEIGTTWCFTHLECLRQHMDWSNGLLTGLSGLLASKP